MIRLGLFQALKKTRLGSGSFLKLNTIKAKLVVSFVIIILILEAVCIYPLISYKQPIQKYDDALDYVAKLGDIKTISDNMVFYLYRATNTFKIVDFSDNTLRNETYEDLANIQGIFEALENKQTDEKTKSALQGLKNMYIKYSQNCKDVVSEDESVPYQERVTFYKNAKSMSEFMLTQILVVTAAEMNYSKTLRAQLQKTTNQIILITILINLVILILSILAAFIIANGISRAVKSLSQLASNVAKGDLTNSTVPINTKDELSHLSCSFSEMVMNIREMIGIIQTNSDRVLDTALLMSTSADQSSLACEQIAASMQIVAGGASRQAQNSINASSSIEKIYLISKKIADKSDEVRLSSERAFNTAETGNKSIADVVRQIDFIYKTMKNSAYEAEELQKKSKEISKIVDVIKSITEQTNLLSLNASIEAARAGENGRGFAVVAGEIRKLADQTTNAAGKITAIVMEIQQQSNKMSESMKTGMGEINRGINITNEAGDLFSEINGCIFEVNNRVEDIDGEIRDLREQTSKIKEFSTDIVDISSQSAENSQEVAASVEELSASMTEMQNISNKLTEMANDLKTLVDRFVM